MRFTSPPSQSSRSLKKSPQNSLTMSSSSPSSLFISLIIYTKTVCLYSHWSRYGDQLISVRDNRSDGRRNYCSWILCFIFTRSNSDYYNFYYRGTNLFINFFIIQILAYLWKKKVNLMFAYIHFYNGYVAGIHLIEIYLQIKIVSTIQCCLVSKQLIAIKTGNDQIAVTIAGCKAAPLLIMCKEVIIATLTCIEGKQLLAASKLCTYFRNF